MNLPLNFSGAGKWVARWAWMTAGALGGMALTAQAQIDFQTLDVPQGGEGTFANGISEGVIAGVYYDDNGAGHGFLYNGSGYTTLDAPLGVDGTIANGIDGGNVVGAYTDSKGSSHGFLFNGGTYTTLNAPAAATGLSGGTFAYGVDGGNIAGVYLDKKEVSHGFLYKGGVYTVLNDPLAGSAIGEGTVVFGLQGSNIVGFYTDTAGNDHGFIYNGSAYTTLDDPAATSGVQSGTYPEGIDGGNIVGTYTDSTGNDHGFFYSAGTYTTFDAPGASTDPGSGTFANGVAGGNIVGYYIDVDGNPHGFVASIVAELPVITTQPEDQAVLVGGPATFTAAATGGLLGPTLQWQVSSDGGTTWDNLTDNAEIAGATSGTLTVSNTTTDVSGDEFQLVATNAAGSATSDAATLTVATAAPVITTPPAAQTTLAGQGVNFTVAASGGPPPAYQWQISTDGGDTWGNLTDGGNFTGTGMATLVISNVTAGMAGDQFRAVATNAVSQATSTAATLSIEADVVITAFQTIDNKLGVQGTFIYGIDGSNLVGAYGDKVGNDHGFLYNGTTFTALVGPPKVSQEGTLATGIEGRKIVGGYTDSKGLSHGFVYNGTAYVTVDDPLGAQGGAVSSISGGNLAGYYTDSSGDTHGFIYNGATFTTLDDPLGANGTIAFGISGSDVVGNYTDGNGLSHGFLYDGSQYITIDDPLGVQGTAAFGISGGNIYGYYNDSAGNPHGFLFDGNTYTTLDIAGSQGTYLFGISGNGMVGGYIDANGNSHGFLTGTPPAVVSFSANETVGAGQAVTLSVSASGQAPLKYQWQHNGVNLKGATLAAYKIAKAAAASGGTYDVVVTNGQGNVTSAVMTLTVITITKQPVAKTVAANASAVFSVTASATGAATLAYQWQFSNTTPVNFTDLGGETQATLTVTNAMAANQGSYRVVVSNGGGSLTSTAVKLTVKKATGK
jgi:hypothetical protein